MNTGTEENNTLATDRETNVDILTCKLCKRTFRTVRGLNQHLRTCSSRHATETILAVDKKLLIENVSDNQVSEQTMCFLYKWAEYDNITFERNVNYVYEKVVYWRKNLFLLTTGKAGQCYIDEITKLMNDWAHDSPLKEIAFKAIMLMPNLLLQKPSKRSKSKDNILALERRMCLWYEGNVLELLKEGETIQKSLASSVDSSKNIDQISKRFAEHIHKGNVNGAIKVLTSNMQNGILPLNEKTLKQLRQRHPEATEETLLPDKPEVIHPIKFEKIDAEMVRKAAIKTKGGAGPSGMDADGWRRIFASKTLVKVQMTYVKHLLP